MDKLTKLILEMADKDLYVIDITDQLEEVGIYQKSPDDAEHFYWYSDDIELGEDEVGAYDIEDLPYNIDGSVNQSVYDTLVDVITKYINEHTN